MSDVLFHDEGKTPHAAVTSVGEGLRPGLYHEDRIVGCFHPRILSRPVGHKEPGTKVRAVFHRRASDGFWSVDILEDEPNGQHLALLKRSSWVESRDAADRWLRYRSRRL